MIISVCSRDSIFISPTYLLSKTRVPITETPESGFHIPFARITSHPPSTLGKAASGSSVGKLTSNNTFIMIGHQNIKWSHLTLKRSGKEQDSGDGEIFFLSMDRDMGMAWMQFRKSDFLIFFSFRGL